MKRGPPILDGATVANAAAFDLRTELNSRPLLVLFPSSEGDVRGADGFAFITPYAKAHLDQRRSAGLANKKKAIRRKWITDEVRHLKSLAKQKLGAAKIAKKLKRTKSAVIAKAFILGVSLEARS